MKRMKRSEFVARVLRLAEEHGTTVVEAATLAAQEYAGVPWDPEQPELPGRLTLEKDSLGGLMIEEGPGRDEPWIDLSLVASDRPLHPEEIQRLKELLARYNAWGRLVEWLDIETRAWTGARGLAAVGLRQKVREYLQREREKLR